MILKLSRNRLIILAISVFIVVNLVLYFLVENESYNRSSVKNEDFLSKNEVQKLMEYIETLKSQLSANEILGKRLTQKFMEISLKFDKGASLLTIILI